MYAERNRFKFVNICKAVCVTVCRTFDRIFVIYLILACRRFAMYMYLPPVYIIPASSDE